MRLLIHPLCVWTFQKESKLNFHACQEIRKIYFEVLNGDFSDFKLGVKRTKADMFSVP